MEVGVDRPDALAVFLPQHRLSAVPSKNFDVNCENRTSVNSQYS